MKLFHQPWRLHTADFSGVCPSTLDDGRALERLLERSLAAVDLVVTRWIHHRFDPQGVSLLGYGPRVRVAVHTWPEHEAATVDVWVHGEGGQRVLESYGALLPPGARTAPWLALGSSAESD